MCGIAGIVRFDDQPIDLDRAGAMLAHMRHRGPDGEGVTRHGRCVFVHVRLSIIDLLSGAQPMEIPALDSHGALSLIFNGEIYNHRALRRQLQALGHRFVSDHCDTEVLLHGYRQWGVQLPKHLHGMFAFAIWDEHERELFLCRDRAGKKPLYLLRATDGSLRFASLVGTLLGGLRGQEKPAIDPGVLRTYLEFGYTFEKSLLLGVEELPAAHWALVSSRGGVKSERYWRPPPISRSSTSAGAGKALHEVLLEAIHERLEADVPLGCFLSGGIDSSLIAAVAQKRLHEMKAGPLRTFSVAMPDIDYDESRFARAVAQHIGSDHVELVAAPSRDVIGDLTRLIQTSGEPTADSSILPTYWLSQATRRHVKSVLSGDGGDELFGGYDRYRAMSILARHRGWLRLLPSVGRGGSPFSFRTRLRRLIDAARDPHPMGQYRQLVQLFSPQRLDELGLTGHSPPLPDWPDEPDPAHAAMRWDFLHYLPFDLLRKIDRASMAVALEVRCPMLATAVTDLAGHLPSGVLMPGGRQKGLLRTVARQYLPGLIIDRPKRGFALPIGRWFTASLAQPLRDALSDGTLETVGLRRQPVLAMLDEHLGRTMLHTHRLFALLSLSLFLRWRNGL